MSRALAGVPPGCEPVLDVVGDVLAGHAVSFVEGTCHGRGAGARVTGAGTAGVEVPRYRHAMRSGPPVGCPAGRAHAPRLSTPRYQIAVGPPHGRPPGRRVDHANRWEGTTRGCRHHEAAPRGRCPLRAPDPPLEPQDEAVHLRRAQRHLHHRSAADPGPDRDRLHLRPRRHRPRRQRAVRRHQEAGAGPDPAVRRQVRHAVHQRALARRHADQLPDHEQAGRQDARARAPCATPASSRPCPRRKRC